MKVAEITTCKEERQSERIRLQNVRVEQVNDNFK